MCKAEDCFCTGTGADATTEIRIGAAGSAGTGTANVGASGECREKWRGSCASTAKELEMMDDFSTQGKSLDYEEEIDGTPCVQENVALMSYSGDAFYAYVVRADGEETLE